LHKLPFFVFRKNNLQKKIQEAYAITNIQPLNINHLQKYSHRFQRGIQGDLEDEINVNFYQFNTKK